MLKAIMNFVERELAAPAEQNSEQSEHSLRLATAALLVEVSRQDETIEESERNAIASILRQRFELSDQEVDELYSLAEQEVTEATDYYQFTSLIKDRLSMAEKERVVELLWQVAVADGHVDSFEEHMIRRIADLLYIEHGAYIRAKHWALEQQ